MPVQDGCRLTSPYNLARTLRGVTNPHWGADWGGIVSGQSTPVYAPTGGTIRRAGGSPYPYRSGAPLVLDTDGGGSWYMGHTRNYKVKPGQRVARGQRLADTWHTGIPAAWGVHLHGERWTRTGDHTSHTDPLAWLASHGWGMDGGTPNRLYDVWAWWGRYADPDGKQDPTRAQQRMLRDSGDYTGAIDGQLGPESVKALQRFLTRHGFYNGAIDGQPGLRTRRSEIAYLRKPPTTITHATPAPTTPAPAEKDWLTMATKDEVAALLRAEGDRIIAAILNAPIQVTRGGESATRSLSTVLGSIDGQNIHNTTLANEQIGLASAIAQKQGMGVEEVKAAARDGARAGAEAAVLNGLEAGVEGTVTVNLTAKE